MNIIKKVKSWDGTKDCFGNTKPESIDHIYPRSKGGSNINENKQILSQKSNDEKKDKSKGKIGDQWKFAILKQQDKEGNIFGIMYIRKKSFKTNDWYQVIPVT